MDSTEVKAAVKEEVIEISSDEEDFIAQPGPGYGQDITISQATQCQTWGIRAWFAKRYMKRPLDSCTIIADDSRRYPCKLSWHVTNKNQCAICQGWYKFMRDKKVKAGDRIHFFPTTKRHVFHVLVSRGRQQ